MSGNSGDQSNEIIIFSDHIRKDVKQIRLKAPAESALNSHLTNIVCSQDKATASQHGLEFYQGYLFKPDDFIPVRGLY